ncbi:MAG: hypothetical protein FWE84_00780 [Firmicutes bacterium]|nr:hypothetical protein [Bacillota bacterium]
MRGYACSHCGAKFEDKLKPPSLAHTHCPECGKPLIVKMSITETTVTARIVVRQAKRQSKPKEAYG